VVRSRCLALATLGLAAVSPMWAVADEGGVSFWAPGTFGSLSATPQQAGWSFATIYYYTSVSAGSALSLSRSFRIGQIPSNLTANLNANANLKGTAGLGWVIPSYAFETPILGAQLAVSVAGIYGRKWTICQLMNDGTKNDWSSGGVRT